MIKNTLKYLFYLYYAFVLLLIFAREYVDFYVFSLVILGLYFFLNRKWYSLNRGGESRFNSRLFFYLGIGILISWILPLVVYDTPLGYDPGLYKYLYDTSFDFSISDTFSENWMNTTYPLGLSYLYSVFEIVGFESDFVLTYLLYFLTLLMFFMFYIFVKEYSSEDVANISAFLFSCSYVVFYVFFMNYYKNILGLILIFFLLILVRRRKWVLSVFVGAFLFGLHRPSFAIYGILHLFLFLYEKGSRKGLFVSGVLINVVGLLFYFYNYDVMLLSVLDAASSSLAGSENVSSGSFLSVWESMKYCVIFLPFFLIGCLMSYREHKIFTVWLLACSLFITFEFFFYKRLIIFLIFPFIVVSALGMREVFSMFGERVFRGFVLVCCVLFFFSYLVEVKPLISDSELELIKDFGNEYSGERVIVLHKYYSPWIKGYVGGDVIAPGLFDENEFNKKDWANIWNGNLTYFYRYEGAYVFAVDNGVMNVSLFSEDDCFDAVDFGNAEFSDVDGVYVFKVGCE